MNHSGSQSNQQQPGQMSRMQQQQPMQQQPMHHLLQQQQLHNPMDPQPFYIAQDALQQPQQQPPRRTWGQPQPISFATTGPEPYSAQRGRQQWGGVRPYGGYSDPYGSPQQQQQQPYGGPNYGSPYDRSPYGQQPGPPMGQPYGGYGGQPPMQPISPYGAGQSAYMQSPPMHHLPQSATIAAPAAPPPAVAPFRLHDSGGAAGAGAPLSRATSAAGFNSPAGPSVAGAGSVTSPIRRASEGPMYVDQQQSDFASRQSARESALSPGGRRLHSSVPAPQVIHYRIQISSFLKE